MKRKLTNNKLSKRTIAKILTGCILLFFIPKVLSSQCAVNVPDCASAPAVCLPTAGTMGPINNSGAIPGCGGGWGFHNTSWFEITVSSTSVAITITPSACQSGLGIQAGLYEECDPNSPNLGVQCSCTTGPVSFSGATVPGETYYIMIDGCSGDICEYEIALTGGEIECAPGGPLTMPDPPIPNTTPICPGTQVTFMTNVVPGADDYIWNFPPGVTILDLDCNMATVIWGSNSGPVTVTAWNQSNPLGITSDPTFIDVPTYEGWDGGEFCFPDDLGWYHSGTDTYYPGGDFDIPMMTPAGCDSTVHISVIQRSSEINVVYEQICEGSSTCSIGGIVISQAVGGMQILIPDASAFGCDSIIIATVDVISGETSILDPDTLNCDTPSDGMPLAADPVPGAEYQWFTTDGNIVGPDDELLIYVDQPGTYIVYATITGLQGDVCGAAPVCFASDTVEVVADFSQPEIATDGVDPTCGGNNDGSVSVNVTNGGTPPFSYLWDDPSAATTPSVTDLPPGNYHVTVTGTNGCFAVDSMEILAPSDLAIDITDSTDVSCFGETDGSISLSVSGGSTPYTYGWSHDGSLSGNTATNLPAGSYTATVTDNNNCSFEVDVDIQQPAELVATGSTQNADCNGNNSGSASITVNGGAAPYTYTWPPGTGSGSSANNLPAGTYNVTVTDDNGCSDQVNLVVSQPTALDLSEDNVQNVSCNALSDGEATVSTSGGMAPYSYLWSNSQTGPTATNLAAGSYTVVVTDDNNCTAELSVDVTQPVAIALTEDSSNDILCNGQNNGAAAVSANGGTTPYTYTWTGGLTGASQNNLAAGIYTVVVEDANSCTQSIDIEILEPPLLTLTEQSSTDVACNGDSNGSASVVGSGGMPPYSYDWSDGQNGANVNDLDAGTHTVTITDDNGCTETLNILIGEPGAITLLEDNVVDASCEGVADGAATVSASGGSAPYSFDWSNGSSGSSVNGLAADTYQVTVTDDRNCTETISVTVNEPDALDITETDNQDASCAGLSDGSSTISVSGGSAPYSYAWSNGQSGATNNSLDANTHDVTVTDDNGCSETISITIDEPAPIVLTEDSVTDALCDGSDDGEASVSASGGNTPYSFEWSDGQTGDTASDLPAGTYQVTVTDDRGCTTEISVTINQPTTLSLAETDRQDVSCNGDNDGQASVMGSGGIPPYSYDWSGGQSGSSVNDLDAGSHTVTITDDNGCTQSLDITIDEPAAIILAEDVLTDASCAGVADGTASVTVSGGTAPYSFDWSNGASGSSVNGLAADDYDVIVTDDNGCSETISLTIDEPATLDLIETNNQDASCTGLSDGSSTISVSGGSAPYSYAWSNGQSGATNNSLDANTHDVTVTDDNGCSETISITIDEPAPIVLTEDSVTDALCDGSDDGEASVSASGGNTPYSFEWSDGQTGDTASDLPAGTYQVTVTDDRGCTTEISVTINQPTTLSLAETDRQDVSCNGDNDGQASVMGSGGIPPYSYDWSGGQSGSSVNDLDAGSHTVTITDDNGCTQSLDITIDEPAAIILAEDVLTDASCAGVADGTASVTVSGGTTPYSFDWSNGASGSSVNGLAADDYDVIVTDDNGCSETISLTIDEPATLDLIETNNQDASCAGLSDGSSTVNASGGTAPYSYAWSNGQSGATNNSLDANTHDVTVTDDNGCTQLISITVDEPEAIVLTEQNVTDALCDGGADGTATVSASGGNTPYSYAWSNGQSGATANSLVAGTYQVTVTDDRGCTDEISVTVDQPSDLTLAEVSQQNVSCNGDADGTASVMASGGIGPYTYQWSNGQIGADATGLSAGAIVCIVTDDNGCTEQIDVTISEPAALSISEDGRQDANCFGSEDGTASVIANGGTAPFSYSWSNGQSGATATALAAGSYTAVITDANDCTAQIDITIAEPTLLEASASGTDALCNGGNEGIATVTPTGGTPPYSYQWDDATSQSTATAIDLSAGNYSVIITDDRGCTATANVSLSEPEALQATTDATMTLCSNSTDGTASVTASGGTAPYTYLWQNGQTTPTATNLPAGNVSVEVRDANGCLFTANANVDAPSAISLQISAVDALCRDDASGSATVIANGGTPPYSYLWNDSQGQPTPTADNLLAGTYIVTVMDANGCTMEDNIAVDEPAQALTITEESITQATCGNANGSVDISVSGGTAPYTFSWSNGSTGEDPSGLTPGNVVVTVTDANNCEATQSFNVSEPNALNISQVSSTDVLCNGGADGTISISTEGGTMPYTYQWNTGAVTEDLTNLATGDYVLEVTDADGCTFTASVTINEPEAISASAVPSLASCGLSDGSINLTVNGGTSPYNYAWSNGAVVQDPDQVPAGDYDVLITDANGCTFTVNTTVANPNPPVISFVSTDVNCFSGADGSVDLTITGGTQPYDYQWSDASLNGIGDHNTLTAGNYTVTVIDRDNCTAEQSFTITEPAAELTIDELTVVQATCGAANGSIDIDVNGGTAPYNYEWSNGVTSQDNNSLTPGVYTITVTDANDCTVARDFNVSEPNALQISDVAPTDVSCNGGNDGSIDVTTIGGTTPYTFSWDNGAGTEDINTLIAGEYNLTITDNDGCTVSTKVTIAEPDELTATAEPTTASCGLSDGSINLIPDGGTRPYSFQWSHGSADEDPVGLPADQYSVVITDANGCTLSLDTEIINPNSPQIAINAFTNVNCNGGADGTADISITGGSGTYTIEWSDASLNGQEDPTTLSAGTYTIMVIDSDNCTDSETFEITEPEALSLQTDNIVQATCGQPNGSVSVTISGGTLPYSYAWSGGAGTNEDASGLVPGDYTLTVTDANGCELIESFSVTEPDALQADGQATDVSCNGGTDGGIEITVMGGTAPYTFQWDSGETTEDIDNLAAGNYTLVVSDADGCTFSISRLVAEPTPIEITGVAQQAICNEANGSINLTVTGGTPGYSFDWDDPGVSDVEDPGNLFAGTYAVIVTDANGCSATYDISVTTPNGLIVSVLPTDVLCFGDSNGDIDATIEGGVPPFSYLWTNGATTEDLSDVPQGSYTITVTDSEGCTVTATANINQPEALVAQALAPLDASCNGSADGSIDLEVLGGTAPYTYLWSNGAGTQEDPSGLPAGSYIVTVTDANGCVAEEEAVIEEPPALSLSVGAIDAECNGSATGSLSSTVSGGTPPYSYDWSGTIDDVANPANVPAGTFSLLVTDANGCEISSSATVGQPAAIQIQIIDESENNGFNTSCFDVADGYVQVVAIGGNTPFAYSWSTGDSGDRLENLSAGTYEVIVTDSKGCTQALSVTMTAPEPMIVSAETADPTCFGDGNGFIFIEDVSGGSGPYVYSFEGGPFTSSPQFTNLHGGTYEVIVQDANGCEWADVVSLAEPAELLINLGDDTEIPFGEGITLIPQANAVNFTFEWTRGAFFDDSTRTQYQMPVTPLATTTYEIAIVDENGCVASDLMTVFVSKERPVFIPNAFTPDGNGFNDLFQIYARDGIVKNVKQFVIFDRWGEIVHQRTNFMPTNDTDTDNGWDGYLNGKLLNPAVFIYLVEIEFIDGTIEMYKGDLTLVNKAE